MTRDRRGVLEAVCEAAWAGRPPAWVDQILPRQVPDPTAFVAGPILTGRWQDGPDSPDPTRLYVANSAGDAAWRQMARQWVGEDAVATVLAALPDSEAAPRRMLDTDGKQTWLYLDDLQQTAHALAVPDAVQRAAQPEGSAIMCVTWGVPHGGSEHLTRHARGLPSVTPAALLQAQAWLHARGLTGLGALRWQGQPAPTAWLCINEDRHRGSVARSSEASATLWPAGGPSQLRWQAVRAAAAQHGLVAYPDAIECFADGRLHVTVGLARH